MVPVSMLSEFMHLTLQYLRSALSEIFAYCFIFLGTGTDNSLLAVGTGEHGVGISKKEFLYDELGEGTVELMKTIKRAIDPLGLFNPGKVSLRLTFR